MDLMNTIRRAVRVGGFTMIELVVTMTIVGILAAIGVPSFNYITTSNRITGEINGLLGDLQFARSEAVKQGLPVTVCASSDGATCNGGIDWESGWIVFLDSNGDQIVQSATEAVVRTQTKFTSTDTLRPSNGTFGAITFNREGYATTNSTATVTMLLHDSTLNTQWTRCLAITPVGALSTQRVPTGNCT